MISERNNFDSLRLIAALAVLFSHTFPLTSGSDEYDPLYQLSGGQATVGSAAVAVFFIISGFLITRSFEQRSASWRDILSFIFARCVRILPALFVVLVLLAFVLGPALSSLPAEEYFSQARVFSFVGVNLSLITFRDGLPGVLTTNPFPSSIDGSLWTLKYEARCYLVVLVIGLSQILNWRVIGVLFLSTLSAVFLGFDRFWLWELGAFFLGGSLLYLRPLPLNGGAALVSFIAILGSCFLGGFSSVAPIFGSYLVIWLALSPVVRLPSLAKHGDLSYGVYLYAFPVQQVATMLLGVRATWYWNGLISTPITLLLAYLSWKLVERPALSLKKLYFRGDRSVVANPRSHGEGSDHMEPKRTLSPDAAPPRHSPSSAGL